MTAYAFEALDAEGKTVKDLIDADSPRAARSALRARGLAPVSVQPAVGSAAAAADGQSPSLLQLQIFTPRVLNQVGLTVWTRQLAGLVSSGLPLERALTALGEEAEKPELRHLLANLRAEVNAGASFAKALQQHPKEFDEIYTAVIAAGEGSGNLGLVLDRLADDPGLTIMRSEFDAASATLVGKVEATVAALLRDAGVAAARIDTVFFTGGSSGIPRLRQRIAALLPQARAVEGDLFGSIGAGLAVEAARRYG